MTSVQINYLMVVTIIIALGMLGSIFGRVKRWIGWSMPVVVLLLHGMVYSVIYIIDASDGGIKTPMIYNLWNNVLRGQTYLTVIAYVAAFHVMQRRILHHG